MIVKGIATIALALAPALVGAQGNQGRPGGGRRGGGMMVSAADVQKRDPIAYLLDKHKSLELTDEQTASLKKLDEDMHSELAPSYKQLDSLRGVMRQAMGGGRQGMSDEMRQQMRSMRTSYNDVIKVISDRYDAGASAALQSLNEEQQAEANKLFEKRREEMQREMEQRRGPGGGRRGGGGGGGVPSR